MPNVKTIDLTFDEVNSVLAYDPVLGIFTWKVDVSKNVKAGSLAGCFKGVRTSKKTGKSSRYMYIRYNGWEVPAARIAWLLTHRKWPEGNVRFEDDDPTNLKLENLVDTHFNHRIVDRDGKKRRVMPKDAQRHYGLKRYYGLTLAEYGEKLVAQNGVCAICEKPETAKLHGKVKPLSVDHNHDTGEIRDLLCSSCNHLLGHAREDRNILLAAVKYLDKHLEAGHTVVSLHAKR